MSSGILIAGAGGHAVEVYAELIKAGTPPHEVFFFDDVNLNQEELFGRLVFHHVKELPSLLRFIPGTGNSSLRKKLFQVLSMAGHIPANVISPSADISILEVTLGNGLNIMHQVYIGPRVTVGDGTLINNRANIHHDSRVGEFCEICPGVHVSGNCTIGDEVFLGTGAVILPGITVGSGAVVAAGSVVTADVPSRCMVAGIPAQIKKQV